MSFLLPRLKAAALLGGPSCTLASYEEQASLGGLFLVFVVCALATLLASFLSSIRWPPIVVLPLMRAACWSSFH